MEITTIKAVYNQTHQIIKNDPDLIEKIRELATDSKNQLAEKYLCTGLQVNGIYLGLDFNKRHIDRFLKILTHTMVIENLSNHTADLSRVLLRVIIDGKHLANLTEDVSENGKFKVYDGGSFFGPYTDYLESSFKSDVQRAVFIVYDKSLYLKEREGFNKPQPIVMRMPIIDLDHIELIDMLAPFYVEKEKVEQVALESHTLKM